MEGSDPREREPDLGKVRAGSDPTADPTTAQLRELSRVPGLVGPVS